MKYVGRSTFGIQSFWEHGFVYLLVNQLFPLYSIIYYVGQSNLSEHMSRIVLLVIFGDLMYQRLLVNTMWVKLNP